ncbi:MAG: TRAP transporter large permease subunit [Pseudomonadota bacterium]
MEIWALVMLATVVVLLFLGYPVAFTLGAVSAGFGLVWLGLDFFSLLPMRIWGVMTNFTLISVPLFIFMGVLLEKSGIAEELLETMGMLFGRLRGGMAISIVLVGTLLAATTGVVGATVVTMTVIALPAMLKHGFSPNLATGTIAASGTLGQIIPPSVILIILSDVMGVPAGQLFAAAVIPGLLLVAAYILYIAWVAWRRPSQAPAIKREGALAIDNRTLILKVFSSLLPPLVLVIAVLGSIFFGIASPTESAAIGAIGALVLALTHRRLTLSNLQDAMRSTTRLTSMVFIILIGATAFGLVFRGMGGDALVHEMMTNLPGGVWGFLVVSMLLLFVLGFFLDFLEICFIAVPILVPIAAHFGIDPLWFAVLIAVNLQTSFLTPPFGFSLFYLKAAAPPQITMTQIYRGIIPFVVLQLAVLALVIAFPDFATWLPGLLDAVQGL